MASLWSWFAAPYDAQFMRNAAVAATIVGVLAPAVGIWIVQRRLSYLGDATSHATLFGVAGAYLVGQSLAGGALAAGLVMGLLIAILNAHPRLAEDAIIGVVETAMFALGVILISRSDRIGVDLSHFLFGQIATVSNDDLRTNAILAVIALSLLFLFFRDLRASTFDPTHASLVGIRVGALRYALLALLSITIVVSLQTVGLLMSVAMLVTPASAARLASSTMTRMLFVAMGVGIASALGGLTLSYHLASPSGATIALVACGMLAVTFAVTVPVRLRRH
ncbi:MAG: metal ABC transporter permease [Actinobacteria bacterium]|nr:metal ABC transporter permease [Actinomycetota bacterium]